VTQTFTITTIEAMCEALSLESLEQLNKNIKKIMAKLHF